MTNMYVYRLFSADRAVLKVFNEAGEELSVSFDDSCGAMHHLGRVRMARFMPNDGSEIGEETFGVTAEDLLQSLAAHLGYKVEKI